MRAETANLIAERCSALRQRFNIRVPTDLSQAIRAALDNISNDTITEVLSQSPIFREPFSTVIADGPWDDIMAYGFRCTICGQLFSSPSVNIYHGSGGE